MRILRDGKKYVVEFEVDGEKRTLQFPLKTPVEMINMAVEIEKNKCRKTK